MSFARREPLTTPIAAGLVLTPANATPPTRGAHIHATFVLLLGWVAFSHIPGGAGAIYQGLALVIAVFTIVVMHELGHALVARRFGIRTRDITLLPIGGVSHLERIPEKPIEELLVTAAGPAISVVLAERPRSSPPPGAT